MQTVTEWLRESLGLAPETQVHLAVSLGVVVLLLALRWLVLAFVYRRSDDVRVHYRWKKASTYVTFLIVALALFRIWIGTVGSLATFLGLLSAGLAIALRDPLVNLAGWAFILWRRPFEVGDRVQVGDTAGDVIDVRIFQFTLIEIGNWVHADQSTGRVIHVPNGRIFTDPLANYTSGFQFIWNEIPVLVTFESDWEKAKGIVREVTERHVLHLTREAEEQIKRAARRYMIFYSKLSPTVYTSVEASGVLLTARYLCPPRNRRGSAELIWEDVLREFARHDDIELAYPTQRFYDRVREERPSVRGEESGDG